jgi:hypothetical protein
MPDLTLSVAYVHDPKGRRGRQHLVVHFYETGATRMADHEPFPSEEDARARVTALTPKKTRARKAKATDRGEA